MFVSRAAVARRIVGRRVGRASAGSDPSPGSCTDTLASCAGRSALRRPATGRSTAITRHLQHRLAATLPQLPGVHLGWLRACCLLHLQKLRDLIEARIGSEPRIEVAGRSSRIEFEYFCLEREGKKGIDNLSFESFDLSFFFFFFCIFRSVILQ